MNTNRIASFLKSLFAPIANRLTPNTAQVVASVIKLETKLEAAIAKDLVRLGELADLSKLVTAARDKTDSDVNAAYKLLHNVSSLTR